MTRVTIDEKALEAFRLSEGMQRVTREKAETVAAAAKLDAPVRTGTYRDSIQVASGIVRGRAMGRVFSDVRYAAVLEFGTPDTPKFRTLGRALDSIADE